MAITAAVVVAAVPLAVALFTGGACAAVTDVHAGQILLIPSIG